MCVRGSRTPLDEFFKKNAIKNTLSSIKYALFNAIFQKRISTKYKERLSAV